MIVRKRASGQLVAHWERGYFHKLYAFDIVPPELERPDKAALEKAMQGHIVARAVLLGTYQKRK